MENFPAIFDIKLRYEEELRFIYYNDTLYGRSYKGLLLRCLGKDKSVKALEEAHSGIYGAHQSPTSVEKNGLLLAHYDPRLNAFYEVL